MPCSGALSRAFNKRLSQGDTVEELNERKGSMWWWFKRKRIVEFRLILQNSASGSLVLNSLYPRCGYLILISYCYLSGQNIEKVGFHRNFPAIEVYALATLFDFSKNKKNDDELGMELMKGINRFEESVMFD